MSEAAISNWQDISDEVERTYFFPDGSTYSVEWPQKLSVKQKPEGDSHRIIADNGVGHYIKAGWLAIRWKVKAGKATIAF